jgi:hypothetical protein
MRKQGSGAITRKAMMCVSDNCQLVLCNSKRAHQCTHIFKLINVRCVPIHANNYE